MTTRFQAGYRDERTKRRQGRPYATGQNGLNDLLAHHGANDRASARPRITAPAVIS